MMALLWDLGRLLWLAGLLAAVAWLPAALAARTMRPSILLILEQTVATVLITVVAVTLLSPAHLLNPFTLLLAYVSSSLGRWVIRHRRSLAADARESAHAIALRLAIRVENAADWRDLGRSGLIRLAPPPLDTEAAALTPGPLMIVIAVLLSAAPAFAIAIANTRLINAGEYGVLLKTQQLFAGDGGWRAPDIVGGVAAAISVVSSIAAVHVVRFLTPLAGLAALLTFTVAVRLTTASLAPAVSGIVVAALLLGGSAQPIASAMAAIFIVLAILFWWRATWQRGAVWIAATATLLAAVIEPASLLIIGTSVSLMIVAPSVMLIGAGVSWIVASWLTSAAGTLGWALLASGLAHAIVTRYAFRRPPLRAAFAVAVIAVAAAVNAQKTAAAHFVEYDAAARQTLDIVTQFPKYRWMIVAPVEEWSLSYGRGWHMNLHQFVEEVGSRIDEEGYRLPYRVDELFVFVETQPFATFASEPADVPFEVLIDPVYRHYRSPAGRSSLQYAAHKLCERLRRQNPNTRVYFDDGRLKIYRFTLR